MAERHKSKDGERETEKFTNKAETPAQSGRDGGELARKVGTRAELNNVQDGGDDVERVRKADEKEKGKS